MVRHRRTGLVAQRPRHHEGVAEGGSASALHHARSEMGNSGAVRRLRVEGVLRVVRRAHRLSFDYGALHQGLEAMVGAHRQGCQGK